MIDYHRRMIGDRVRNAAFAEALRRTVRPGKSVVADIGSGTGILGFIASRCGAKECFLYECGDIVRLSKRLARLNKLENVRFIEKHSKDVRHPVRADIVCSETLGNFALEEHIIETMNDARGRYLKPGGVMIPGKLRQFALPLVSDRLHREIDAWDLSAFDLDFSEARAMTFHNIYVRTLHPDDLLADAASAAEFDAIDFREVNESRRSAVMHWEIERDVSIFGLAVWWEAELIPGVTISTSPFEVPTHWEQIVAPLPSPLPVAAGHTLEFAFASDTRWEEGLNVRWRARVMRERKEIVASPQMDMREGLVD